MMKTILEKNVIPDSLMRLAFKRVYKKRIKDTPQCIMQKQRDLSAFIENLKQQPIAIHTDDANEQHYELPAAFFSTVLGQRLKYSQGFFEDSVHWSDAAAHLDQAEEKMLALTCENAQLEEGQRVLELGCGWGSLCLYIAEKYPSIEITAMSNSKIQREFITARAAQKGFKNIEVLTEDINHFETEQQYDRIVSVGMFEHLRNYEKLLAKLSRFINPSGKMLVDIFTRLDSPYLFEFDDKEDWRSFMAKKFFSGGMMPSADLLFYFNTDFQIEKHWRFSGTHYQKSLEAWLARMDAAKPKIMDIFSQVYGDQAKQWWSYWRLYFMGCAACFGAQGGQQWFSSQYLFTHK